MYENAMARRAAGTALPTTGRSETPVYDKLVTEYRDGFRTVPGDPWTPHQPPRFAELSSSSDRFQLPGGSGI